MYIDITGRYKEISTKQAFNKIRNNVE